MSLHGDLLEQAGHLARRERRKPKQASLRRALSAAYYALFHLLTSEASRRLVGTDPARASLRGIVQRAFGHADMSEAAQGFASANPSRKVSGALGSTAVAPELRRVARTFVDLRQLRHDADYNTLRTFTRGETLDFVAQTEEAFADWKRVRGSVQGDVFLVALLLQRQVRGRA